MAETFKNYLTKMTEFAPSSTQVILPKADGNSVPNVVGTRRLNSTSQIHSIYVTKEENINPPLTDISTGAVYISLYIKDVSESVKYYIGQNIKIVPYASFYIEKTITLLPHQTLMLEYSSLNKKPATLNCVCSTVDMD